MNHLSLVYLRSIRKAKKITQEQMAKELGYSSKTGYCELENGHVKMTVEQLIIIKNVLSLTDEEVISFFLQP